MKSCLAGNERPVPRGIEPGGSGSGSWRARIAACLVALALPVAAATPVQREPGDFRVRNGTLAEAALHTGGNAGIEGLALVRPVLQGVLYRAGFKGGDRAHTGLSPGQRTALCEAGFSGARYIDFGTATHFDTTACAGGSFEYAKGSTARPEEVMRQVHAVVKDSSRGPVLLHCMWGVHSSGAVAAMALVQFCGWSEARAKAYWNATRNNAPCSGGCGTWIDAHFRRFVVDPALVPTAAEQAAICPSGKSEAAATDVRGAAHP